MKRTSKRSTGAPPQGRRSDPYAYELMYGTSPHETREKHVEIAGGWRARELERERRKKEKKAKKAKKEKASGWMSGWGFNMNIA